MEDSKVTTDKAETATTKPAAKKTTTKKPAAKRATTAKKTATVKSASKTNSTPKTATAKLAVKKTVGTKAAAPKATTPPKPKVVEKVAPITAETVGPNSSETSTIEKVIKTGKKTVKIVTEAGSIILGSSILTTKAIAGLTTKAGKKAFEIGKELLTDTSKEVKKNQKTVVKTTKSAFKDTVDTIKDSNIIENPLKKKK